LLWPSLTKDMQTERLLCWSGMTVTEHSKTSSSNEEDYAQVFVRRLVYAMAVLVAGPFRC